WREGEKYHLNIPLEGRGKIKLVEELREIFGYHNTETLRRKIGEGELELVAYFDNEKYAICRTRELEANVPEGAKVLKYVEIQPLIELLTSTWELSEKEIGKIKNATSSTELGRIGRDKVAAVILGGGVPEIKDVKAVYEEVYITGTKKHVDIVVETEDGRFIVIEVKTTEKSEPEYIEYRFKDGVDQIKEYMELIKEYGLDLSNMGRKEPIKDVDKYWVFGIYFNLENKVVKASYNVVPKD
ncbi:MAG: hypothetical protein QXO75_10390, partial [Nitrososphaerota archaeon]